MMSTCRESPHRLRCLHPHAPWLCMRFFSFDDGVEFQFGWDFLILGFWSSGVARVSAELRRLVFLGGVLLMLNGSGLCRSG